MPDFRRLVRGTIKNALVWGIGWTVLGFAATMLRKLTGNVDTPMTAFDVMIVALKIGLGGGIAGAAFSAYIAYAYRRRDIKSISWLKFGIGGAVATAASITAFVQGASLLGGGGLVPLRYLLSTTAMFAVFGFCVAAVSIKVAQSARSGPSDADSHRPDDASTDLFSLHVGAIPVPRTAAGDMKAGHVPPIGSN